MDQLKAIKTFIKVVDLGSFSEASRQLDIAISAVSRQVTELEKQYASKLLYRTTRTIKLTPEGEFFTPYFRDILQQLDNLETSMLERKQQIKGKLRLTSPQSIGYMGINPAVADFLRRYPNVDLSWTMVNRYVNLVEEGFDLAIRAGALEDSSFVSRKYGQFQMQYAASPSYLASKGNPEHPSELKNHLCLLDSSLATPERLSYFERGKTKQVRAGSRFRLNQGQLLVDFAKAGIGICHLPDFLLEDSLQDGSLIPVLEDFWQPPIDIYFVYPSNKLNNPLVRALIDHLLENLPANRKAA